jgi:CRISPR-associated protein Csh1
MLSAVREIGERVIKEEGKETISVLVDEKISDKEYKVLSILVDPLQKKFEGIDLEDFDSEKTLRYLFRGVFRKGVTSGANPTPAANINPKEPHKTLEGKVKGWFNKYADQRILRILTEKEKVFLQKVKEVLEKESDTILKDLKVKITELSKKEGKILTIKIKQEEKWNYLGDFEVFKKILLATESNVDNASSVTTCSICGEMNLVSPDAGVFKFYTIDKPGFITGGFQESLSWKNFPLCPDCKLDLEEGKRFLESMLAYKFYGLQYILIPRLLSGTEEIFKEIINIFVTSKKTVSLQDKVKRRITNDESEILDLLAEEKDVLTLDFLFLSKEQSAERILLLIEEVFPSRLKRIFEAKDKVDSIFDERFNFGCIREFFSKSDKNKRNYDLNKYFLEIIDGVFKGRQLDFKFLTNFYMLKIRKEFINDGYYRPVTKRALMDTIFFYDLNLITFEEVIVLEEELLGNLFKDYHSVFASPIKKGIFLLGSLTEMLLRKQWKARSAKPFMKSLKGLKMDEGDIRALLPKVQNKFEEYDSFDKGKRLLAKEIADYLLKAGDGWNFSVDEINFYFACGMNLVDKVLPVIYPEGIQDPDVIEQENQVEEE